MSKIAVVGAGLFGVVIASKLAKKYTVDLYESEDEILKAASGINQFRIHRGYHYPRSTETVNSNLLSLKGFEEEFKGAIIDNTTNYYCIAKKNSLTSAEKYRRFCLTNNLWFKEVNLPFINKKEIDVCLQVKENLIDPYKLKLILYKKLKHPNLKLFLKKTADRKILTKYDRVIISTYSNINSLLKKKERKPYQYELCEKIVVKLPKQFQRKSIVILDGPFMCIDPYGQSGLYLLGNVVHAIHQSNVGLTPLVGKRFTAFINKGIIKNSPYTNFKHFIESTEVFIPDIKFATYFGSMYTVRTVLPFKEKTDERPTIVKKVDNKTITVFSGKLVSCVTAASEVENLL